MEFLIDNVQSVVSLFQVPVTSFGKVRHLEDFVFWVELSVEKVIDCVFDDFLLKLVG